MNKQILKDEIKNLLTTIREQTETLIDKENILHSEITALLENVKKFNNHLLKFRQILNLSDEALTIADKLKGDGKSLHEELSKIKEATLADKIQGQKITDLKEIIDINSRFLFIKELFNGSFVEYNKVIEKINNFSTIDEAFNLIYQEVKPVYKWDEKSDVAKSFMKIIERKFGNKD